MDMNDILDGRFRSRQTYFTSISSEVLENKKLSLNAKGLYALIESCISFSDDVTKVGLMEKCGKSAAYFNKAWDELKRTGYLKEYPAKDSDDFEYELLDSLYEGNGKKRERKIQAQKEFLKRAKRRRFIQICNF